MKCTIPSFSLGTGLRLIASIIRNTSRPPSRAGIGSRFITPKLALIITLQLMRFRITYSTPSLLLSVTTLPIAETIPTGPETSFAETLPVKRSLKLLNTALIQYPTFLNEYEIVPAGLNFSLAADITIPIL